MNLFWSLGYGQKYAEELFLDLFEVQNVGNLHLFVEKGEPQEEAYFIGKAIPPEYKDFLPSSFQKRVATPVGKLQAVFKIRGNGLTDHYLMKVPQSQQPARLILYDLRKDRLHKIKDLAYYSCKNGQCKQLDSWVTELNGDGLLDILQKIRTTNKKGKVSTQTKVFLMQPNGKFKEVKPLGIELEDYPMEELSFYNDHKKEHYDF